MSEGERIDELKRTIDELEDATTILVRRDLELKRAYTEIQEVDKRKSEFVSIAAHQLRTPLSAIRWAHQMLLDGEAGGDLTDEQTLVVQQAQQSIEKMISLVNELLNADHLEYDKVSFDRQQVNIDKLLQTAVNELKPMALERRIEIALDLGAPQAEVFCDAERIKEVFLNILNNAIKYSFVNSTVSLKTREQDGNLVVTFNDQGIGIPQKNQAHMFQKFSRADNAKRVDANGSGLGMFIADKIVHAHGGKITFTSEENVGTTFTVSLPVT